MDTKSLGNKVWVALKAYYERIIYLQQKKKVRSEFDIVRYFCGRATHNYVVSVLCWLAVQSGYLPMTECPAKYVRLRRHNEVQTNGRIDVAWFDAKGKLAAVFEVDRGIKQNSIDKLLSMGAAYKFIISLGPAKRRNKRFFRIRSRLKEEVTIVDVGLHATNCTKLIWRRKRRIRKA